ncbi:hypothetical protein [Xanthomonas arboricola]|uniref:hypothetical protein n=1 Tax=Xanthomonas arboricola TaxID=56448 RepID=UPI0011AFF31B|nr:hypothetical protein [Xanthomonas arboricola]
MLDHFEEIVYPAFFDQRIREYGSTKYFFSEVNLVYLGEDDQARPLVGIAGRFIKDGEISREQIYKNGVLVKNSRKMQSSPSSIFLLILHNHRLVYVREMAGAPDKASFRSTLLTFLKSARDENIKARFEEVDNEYSTRKDRREKKDEIYDEYQVPSLQVIPLASHGSVVDFIEKYDVLRQVKITYRATNDENPMGDFFTLLKASKEALGSDKAVVVQEAKKGLDKSEAASQITAAAGQGINSVDLRGTDDAGDTLVGNNDSFQLKKPIEGLSSDPAEAAEALFESFRELGNL